MVDTHPCAKKQFPKPVMFSIDHKQHSKWIYGTGYKRSDFNDKYGIDPKVFQILNGHGQRTAVKSIDLKLLQDQKSAG